MAVKQDWLTDPSGQPSAELVRMREEMYSLLRGNQYTLSQGAHQMARLIVSQLAHKHGFAPEGWRDGDWTVEPSSGRSNSGEAYFDCLDTVANILEEKLLPLLTHNKAVTRQVAEEFLRALTRDHKLVPPKQAAH